LDNNKFIKTIKSNLKPPNIAIAFIIISILTILVVVFVQRSRQKGPGKITEDQIMIQRGEKIVIVDESGLVEYRTADGVFYETWDSSRIRDFFESMQRKAREYLSNPTPEFCSDGYTVTLYLDGVEVTVCMAGDDEDLAIRMYLQLQLQHRHQLQHLLQLRVIRGMKISNQAYLIAPYLSNK
jgi:hypothetical protein